MRGDVSIVGGVGITPVLPFRTDDRATSSATATVKAGEPVKQSNANFVILIADGDPVQASAGFVGIAENESTETSSVEGAVNVSVVVPYITRMRARVKTLASSDTDAELKGLLEDAVLFDLTAGVITVDAAGGDDPNVNGLVIVDGDIDKGYVDFIAKPLVTLFGQNI